MMMMMTPSITHGKPPDDQHLNRQRQHQHRQHQSQHRQHQRRQRNVHSHFSMSKTKITLTVLCWTIFILSVNAFQAQAQEQQQQQQQQQQETVQVAIDDIYDDLVTSSSSTDIADSNEDSGIPAECIRHSNHTTTGGGGGGGPNSNSNSNTSQSRSRSRTQETRYDPLACWLMHLKVHIPDQSFRSGIITVGIQDLVCTNFSIGSLASSYSPSTNFSTNFSPSASSETRRDKDPTMDLSVYNISAVCSGRYSSTGLSGKISTEIAAAGGAATNVASTATPAALAPLVPAPPALAWTLAVHSTTNRSNSNSSIHTPRAPSSVQTVQCVTDLKVVGLHFSGTMSARLVQLFAHVIAKYVGDVVNEQLCAVLTENVDLAVTNVLHRINHFLDPYLTPSSSSSNDNDNNHNDTTDSNSDTDSDTDNHNSNDETPVHTRATATAILDPFLPFAKQLYSDTTDTNYSDTNDANDTATLVDWATEAPGLISTLTIVNDWMETYLHAGFLRHWWSEPSHSGHRDDDQDQDNDDNGDNVPSCNGDDQDNDDDDDDGDCGFVFDGVNGVIRSLLAGQSGGRLHVPVPKKLRHVHFMWPGYGAVELQILDLSLAGVDQWDQFMLFRPRSTSASTSTRTGISTTQQQQQQQQQQEFQSAFRTNPHEAIQLQTDVKLIVRPIPDGAFQGDDLTESFQVHLNVSALDFVANLVLDVDRLAFQNTNLTVSSVVDVMQGLFTHNASDSDQLSCLLQPIRALTATEFAARMHLDGATFVPADMSQNTTTRDADATDTDATDTDADTTTLVTGKLEQDLDALLNNVLELFLQEYQPLVTNAVYGLTRGPVKDAVNKLLTTVTTPTEPCPGPQNDHDHPHLMNFTKVKPLERLNRFLEQPHTKHKMNAYLECATRFISQALKRLASTSVVDTKGISVRLSDFQINNAGSIRELNLLSPEGDGMRLKNFLDYGTSDDANRPRIVAAVELSYAPLNLSATINMTTLVNDFQLGGGSILHYDTNRLRKLPLAQLVSHGQCGLVPINEYESYNVQSSIGRFRTTVKASISSSSMDPVDLKLDSDRHPVVEVLASSILAWVVNSTRDIGQVASITTLSHAEDMCYGGSTADSESEPDDEDDSPGNLTIFLIVAAIFLLTQPGILLIMRSEEIDSTDENSDALLEPLMSPEFLSDTDAVVNFSDEEVGPREVPALMHSAHVPELVRHGIPMLIVGCIMLLLSSNLSVGATVNLTVSTGDEVIVNLPSLFAFSLFNTAKEMLQAGIYPLFFLVLIFSGIWPYVKLFLMLFAWSTPKTRLSADSRGSLLLALDALGKFSLVDTYVLVLMLVAFRYHLDLLEGSALDVYVLPQFGFYGFLIATSLSLVLGHLLVFYHRRSEIHLETETTPAERLIEHSFELDNDNRQLSRGFQAVLFTTLLTTIVLLGFGMTQESFVFEFDGLAGIALGDASRSSYSLLSLGSSLRQSVADPSGAGIIGLQVAYYFYAVVTPFCCLAFLLILLIFPMPLKRQLAVLTMAEIANAWSAVEVFAISIVASLLEISTFASFIIGHRCDMIDAILKEFNDSNSNTGSGTVVTTCYTVRSFIAGNAVPLVLGVVLYSFTVSTVLGLAHAAVHERIRLFSSKEGVSQSPSIREGGHHGQDHHHHKTRTWIHWLSRRYPKTSRWIWRSDVDASFTSTTTQTRRGSSGPPVQGGDHLPLSPWQKKDAFAGEWKEAAERDPAWKEWKEATQVT